MTADWISGRIIDADTHITEPANVWTSRVSSKWGDTVPHVVAEAETGTEHWYIGDVQLGAAAGSACYGWPEHWPSVPPTFAEAHPASYDAPRAAEDHGRQRHLRGGAVPQLRRLRLPAASCSSRTRS